MSDEGRGQSPTDRNDHYDFEDKGFTLVCRNCGARLSIPRRITLTDYAAELAGFSTRHKHCKPGDKPLTDEIKSA